MEELSEPSFRVLACGNVPAHDRYGGVARYFFDLYECGTHLVPDEDGIEVSGPEAIREQAIREARGVMSAEILEGRLCLGCRIEVYDENRQLVLTLPFKDAVHLSGI